MKDGKKTLVDYIGLPALLEQTSEECMELGFACLKLARFLRDENRVHGKTFGQILSDVAEECADVGICINELIAAEVTSFDELEHWTDYKLKRMKERLNQEEEGNDKSETEK